MLSRMTGLKHHISGRTFGFGLGIVFLLYALLGLFLWVKGSETLAKRSEKLAIQTVLIERESVPVSTVSEADKDPAPEEHAVTEDIEEQESEAVAETATPETTEPQVTEPAPETAVTEPIAPPAESVTVAEDGSLKQAPIEGLYEDTTEGRLPVINATTQQAPFQAYRRPFTPVAGQKMISIVLMDIGLSDTESKAVMSEISPEVTLVVTPYAAAPDFWLNESRFRGHEVWLKLPVEPELYPFDDTGPQTLLINGVERQNLNKLNWAMSRGSGYAGFVTGYQSVFMKSANDARPVIHEIYKRGLGFVDGNTTPSSAVESISISLNTPYAHNDVWIDIPSTREHIAASLKQLEVLAEAGGAATGFIHASPMGRKMLQSWIDGLGPKGFVVVPLSVQADIVRAE